MLKLSNNLQVHTGCMGPLPSPESDSWVGLPSPSRPLSLTPGWVSPPPPTPWVRLLGGSPLPLPLESGTGRRPDLPCLSPVTSHSSGGDQARCCASPWLEWVPVPIQLSDSCHHVKQSQHASPDPSRGPVYPTWQIRCDDIFISIPLRKMFKCWWDGGQWLPVLSSGESYYFAKANINFCLPAPFWTCCCFAHQTW